MLVTGATGFVGRKLVAMLLERHYLVNCALRKSVTDIGELSGCHHFVFGDFNKLTDWNGALIGVDTVIHLAARVHVMNETDADPLQRFREANVDTTLRLASEAANAGVQRFIYLSSVKVNGEHTDKTPFSESDTPNPQDPYAQSKYEAEVGLSRLAKETGLEVVIIRPVLVYGPGVKGNFYRLIQLANKSLPLPFAKLHNRRSMIGLDNLVDLIILCISHPAAAGETFLASDGEDISTEKLVSLLREMLGRKPLLFTLPASFLKILHVIPRLRVLIDRLSGSLQVDNNKARHKLNWFPPKSLYDGINDSVQWYLKVKTK
ncbi:MAG: SDR family oxidoreductase [Gammaproteobacteria bacterium]|nr:SDR family oxidoreductase [Gammaproteobacteria bacterium]